MRSGGSSKILSRALAAFAVEGIGGIDDDDAPRGVGGGEAQAAVEAANFLYLYQPFILAFLILRIHPVEVGMAARGQHSAARVLFVNQRPLLRREAAVRRRRRKRTCRCRAGRSGAKRGRNVRFGRPQRTRRRPLDGPKVRPARGGAAAQPPWRCSCSSWPRSFLAVLFLAVARLGRGLCAAGGAGRRRGSWRSRRRHGSPILDHRSPCPSCPKVA